MPTVRSIRGMWTAQRARAEPPDTKKKETAILERSKFTGSTLGLDKPLEPATNLFNLNQEAVVTEFALNHLQLTAIEFA